MKIYDTLIKVDHLSKSNSVDGRLSSELVYSWCHEKNIVEGSNDKHYFVFSNHLKKNIVLLRTLQPLEEITGVTVSYDTNNYKDYLVFSGFNSKDKRVTKLSDTGYRKYFNSKTRSIVKWITCKSKSGNRPIYLYKTEFKNVDISRFEDKIITGIDGRRSYGCGLIIPTKVYEHLMNFV
jgi:hypothetical protein